jgi:3-hydroxyacyl-CoA dehydrogenase/3-hydroxy-2-methylbutyryl-CoA dehydrogenase
VRIENAVWLVTGGASGLGGGTARMLVEKGGKVGILDLPSSAGEARAAEVGPNALFVPTDVSDEGQVENVVVRVAELFGRIVCVNAAGISPAARVLTRKGDLHPLDMFCKTVETNLVGTFDVLRHTVAAMSRNERGPDGERGLIVNVCRQLRRWRGRPGRPRTRRRKAGSWRSP